jgi:hypothetical protein
MPDGKNLPRLVRLRRRRLLEVERGSHNSGWSGDSIQRVVQPTIAADGEKAEALKFGRHESWSFYWR